MKKNIILHLMVISFIFGFGYQTLSAKTILTPFVGFDLMQKAGKESDYLPGERDFCLTDSHTVNGFGLGIKSDKTVYFGFELNYSLKGNALQTDPSDEDTVTIDTYTRASGSILLGVRAVNSPSFSMAFEAGGGGLYLLNAEEKSYTSTAGYETIISPPENAFGAHAFAGLALTAFFTPSVGIHVAARYQIFFLTPQQSAISLQAGLAFRI